MTDRRETFYQTRTDEMAKRYPGFEITSSEVMLNLLYTYDVVSSSSGRFFAEHGLAKSSFNILMNLRHGPPEGMLLHNLGEMLLMTRANVTGLIDHLEEKGLVRRVVDETDRRARFARITKKGEELLDEVAPEHFKRVTERVGRLNGEERATLVALLKKLREGFRTVSGASSETTQTLEPTTRSQDT